jgi:hypothetical protein
MRRQLLPTPRGTLALRGPMVPRRPFPPGAQHGGLPYFKVAPSGFVDTGHGYRRDGATLVLTRPPAGILSVGGYRFATRDLHDFVGDVTHGGGTVAELPDALAGHRRAGMAADHQPPSRLCRSAAPIRSSSTPSAGAAAPPPDWWTTAAVTGVENERTMNGGQHD